MTALWPRGKQLAPPDSNQQTMTDTNEKLRSLFLAALMVFSVFAMTTGFAGSAAAVSNLDAGTFYSGQDVQFDVSNDGNNYQVRTVDDSGDTDQVGSLRRTIDPNDGDIDGTLEFTLDGRLTEGDFVIVNAQSGAVVDLTNGDERVLDSDEGLVASETFEVIPQDLTAEFDDPDVGTSGDSATVDYEIASDVRNGYAVNISAEGLDREELLDILNDDERNAEPRKTRKSSRPTTLKTSLTPTVTTSSTTPRRSRSSKQKVTTCWTSRTSPRVTTPSTSK
ncbi:surface glycoprotein [Halomicroarcula sp. GCM10025710]